MLLNCLSVVWFLQITIKNLSKQKSGWRSGSKFNPSTQEAEAGRSLSLRPAWSSEQVPGQPRLHRESRSAEKKNQLTAQ